MKKRLETARRTGLEHDPILGATDLDLLDFTLAVHHHAGGFELVVGRFQLARPLDDGLSRLEGRFVPFYLQLVVSRFYLRTPNPGCIVKSNVKRVRRGQGRKRKRSDGQHDLLHGSKFSSKIVLMKCDACMRVPLIYTLRQGWMLRSIIET